MEFIGPNVFADGTTVSGPARRVNSQAEREAYERKVLAVRDKIVSVPFGKRLLDLICNNPNPIVIAPSRTKDNADAMALNSARGFEQGAAMPGTTNTGLGGGSTTVVHFNPSGVFRGIGADATLLHELLHAYRKACGRWNMLPMGPLVTQGPTTNPAAERMRFGNWEEWFSVVAEGIYRAEAGATSVRIAHGEFLSWLSAIKSTSTGPSAWGGNPQTDSQIFADRYALAIDRILMMEDRIYYAMRASNAWFNPVRDFDNAVYASRQ